ncbi:ArsR/SmtB family transcription factor [Flindersiella endophytica]
MSGTHGRPATDAEAKALASAVRLRIIRLCLDEARTNKEIAERLGLNPATVLHHVRTLVSTGFLVPQEDRRGTRGAREVPYLSTDKSWRLDTSKAKDTGGGKAMLDAFLAEARLVDPDSVPFARLGLRLSDDDYADLRMRLISLLNEYADRPRAADGKPYSLFVALFDDVSRS